MVYFTNKNALNAFCFVIKHAGSGKNTNDIFPTSLGIFFSAHVIISSITALSTFSNLCSEVSLSINKRKAREKSGKWLDVVQIRRWPYSSSLALCFIYSDKIHSFNQRQHVIHPYYITNLSGAITFQICYKQTQCSL